MHNQFRRAGLVSALLLALPSHATEIALATTVVTATRTPTQSSDLLSDVTIVDREQIDRLGADTLSDLLGRLPGVQVAGNGGRGATGSLSLRGTNTNHTLVLVDGLRLSSATTGATAIESLPLDQIERIEILRGPASSLYGSDAVGGVIQIFTRAGDGAPAPRASFGAGTYRTRQGSVGYGGQVGDTRFDLQAGWEESDSFSSIRAPKGGLYDMYNPDDDDYRNGNVAARFSHRLNEDLSFGGELLHVDAKKRFDSTNCDDFGFVCTADFDNRQRQRLTAYAAHVDYRVSSFWKTSLRLGQSQDRMSTWRHDPSAAVYEVRQRYDTTQDQLTWQNDFVFSPAHRLTAAAEWRRVRVDSTQVFVHDAQTTRSLMLGYQGRYGNHSLQASARTDDIERMGSHETGSLAYGYHLDDAWTLRAGVGTAFHAPTFNDLYWPLDLVNFYQGNPNLKPERARNRELGVGYERGGTRAGLSFFHNRLRDLLDYVPGSAPTWIGTYGNVHSATLKGASFHFAHRAGVWEYRAALDWLSAKDDASGNTLQRRAPRTGTLELRRRFDAAEVGVQLQGVSQRYNDRNNTQTLAGYGLLNVDAAYRLDRDWTLFARLNNALDKEYTVVRSTMGPFNDYATAERNLFVGVRYAPR
ncbi:MAG: TonB-dependent receptor [Rhodocyclaceae bacterium]|nr:TonB-dependent receptor [Rhodocyclaceae bacterium]